LRSDDDEKLKANAAKEFIDSLVKSAGCTFIDAKKNVRHKGTYHMLCISKTKIETS
jgi:hypothetical protein